MSSGENTGEGRVLAGRYRVVSQLGRGGMGIVWRAYDEILGREVAVKELRTYADAEAPELSALRVRMQREARAAARVRHPGVVAVHDVVEAEGRPLIVMELVDGPSLDAVLRERGPLSPREAAGIGAKVMDALAAAHRAGVLHRDVKPGNILLAADGRVVLTDFGIATMEDPGDGSATHLTRSGELVGSLDYLAPERAQGQDPGPPSDVWALGATLYGAVEGSVPFRRTSTWSTLTAIVVEPLPEPVRAGPLAPVLQQLMAKDPQARPDADGAARLLRAVADSAVEDDPTAVLRGAPGAPPPPHASAPAEPHVPTEVSRPGPVPPGFGPATWQQPEAVVSTAGAQPPSPPQPRKRGRTALVAAAVVAVLAAAGGGIVLLKDSGTSGSSASERPGAESTTASPDGRTDAEDKPSTPNGKSPTPSAKQSKDSGAKSPTPSRPAGADGGTTGGSDNGGTDSGGSGSSGTGGSDSGGTNGGTSTGGTTTGGGGQDPAPMCNPVGGGKYNCEVWRTAKSYTASGAEAGILNAGTNYFYCQANLGRRETHGEWTNVWWAKTDDDSGNTDVWISDVYIEGGDNDAPVPGLPVC
ncbi:protein kinase [Streptomyces sp. TRM66268-LWL]|uniref:non-specific serine/threonine protein kinase n=1 Tax=Streptomyces polyasparticus TaxID=2767826 RepID=A0ABR7SKL7_9ACTN|nr:serine/threonine-protein kinase [Streptomyces polyasparticus]MBC9716015.1 protein kinase [Streptomyces polyasparticus]